MSLNTALNIIDYCLTKSYRQFPDKIALILIDQNLEEQSYTFEQLYEAIASCAQGLRELGLKPGDRILIRSVKSVEFFIIYFAAIAAGLIAVAGLSTLTATEIKFILEEVNAAAFYQAEKIMLNIDLPPDCQRLSDQDIPKLCDNSITDLHVNSLANDPAFIVFTSGSTKQPKGVVHAHRSIIGREPIREYWLSLQSDDVVLVTGKPCWTYTMGVGFMDTWSRGATAVVYNGVDSKDIWYKLVERYKVTLFVSSPIYFKQLLDIKNPEDYDLSSLRQATSAGEAIPYEIIEYWQKHFDVNIYEALGMTEMSTFISSGKETSIRKGYVGKIQPGRQVSIFPLDKSTKPVKPNEIGLLAIHRDNEGFMLNYLNPIDNRNAPYRGEWFITGDLVSRDEQDYIKHHGRADDILNIKGGDRISPVEIEEVIIRHPEIVDVACGLTQDESNDNILTAFVVRKSTVDDAVTFINDVKAFTADFLASHKIPVRIILVNTIPRNPNGKIARSKLNSLAH